MPKETENNENNQKTVHWLWQVATILFSVILMLVSALYVFAYNTLEASDTKQNQMIQEEIQSRDRADAELRAQVSNMLINVTLICKTVVGAKCKEN